MKRKLFTTILCLSLITVLLLALASCDAGNNYAAEDSISKPNDYVTESGSGIEVDLGSIADADKENSEYQRKIIKTANVSAETKEFDQALKQIEQLCLDLGGYVESSSLRGQSLDSTYSRRYANYTIRIPAEKFDSFNQGLGNLLNVVSSESNADEVTSTYYDIKSRIEVLEMQKESLQQMYDEYTDYGNISYLLELQDKLYAVIEEIEAYETQIRLYDDKIAYSTVHLSVNEVVIYTEDEEEMTFGDKIVEAFLGGWNVFVSICQGIAIAFVATFPTFAALGIIVFAIVMICVLSSKRKRAKKQRNESQNPQA
ncbi:MAG: DUF4349 domain-containing protein [Clostridia bacterium]|nr:DUF4349 domain-containing protein [Clostridia bacterium]